MLDEIKYTKLQEIKLFGKKFVISNKSFCSTNNKFLLFVGLSTNNKFLLIIGLIVYYLKKYIFRPIKNFIIKPFISLLKKIKDFEYIGELLCVLLITTFGITVASILFSWIETNVITLNCVKLKERCIKNNELCEIYEKNKNICSNTNTIFYNLFCVSIKSLSCIATKIACCIILFIIVVSNMKKISLCAFYFIKTIYIKLNKKIKNMNDMIPEFNEVV